MNPFIQPVDAVLITVSGQSCPHPSLKLIVVVKQRFTVPVNCCSIPLSICVNTGWL